jgi:hypothetical protein
MGSHSPGRFGTLFAADLRALSSSGRYLQLIPLGLGAALAALWPYTGSPFLPLLAALLFGLEPAFANVLFRSARDLEAIALLPVEWEELLLARNCATALGAIILFAVLVSILVYLAPQPPEPAGAADAFLWLGTMLFPLLHIGNELSVREPRRRSGWTFDDVARALVFLMTGAVVAGIHPLLTVVSGSAIPSILFLGASAAYWKFRSVPAAAERIRVSMEDLVMTP